MNARGTGERWERAAESFLQRNGLKTLERNFHSRFGEIDIVMSDGPALVFVEVKYRSRTGHGAGAAHVDRWKRRKLERAAAYYLARHPREANRVCRFDVISVQGDDGNGMNWIRDAFRLNEG